MKKGSLALLALILCVSNSAIAADAVAPKKPTLSCKVVTTDPVSLDGHDNTPVETSLSAADIAGGYVVTGGGCNLKTDKQSTGADATLSESTPDRHSWACRYSHHENRAPHGTIAPYVIACRIQ